MNLAGWLKCWWFQRHIDVSFYDAIKRQRHIKCIRCERTIR